MKPFYLTESLRPYLLIVCGALLLLITGFILNSAIIGALFGYAAACIDVRYNLYFVAGVVAIYCIKKPYVAIATTVVFAILYQIYHSEFSSGWQMRRLEQPSYFSFSRIFGGVLLLSFLGLCHFVIRKFKTKMTA